MSCREGTKTKDTIKSIQLRESTWGQLAIVCLNIRSPSSFNTSQHVSYYCMCCNLSSRLILPNEFSQLEFSSIVLDGHRDSINAIKFDADLSMLLSGGKLLSACLLRLLKPPSRQLWSYNRMGLGIIWTPPNNWCFIRRLRHVSLLDQRFEGWHRRWKPFSCLRCWVWDWYNCNLQAIYRKCKEVLTCLNAMLTAFSFAAPFWVCKEYWGAWRARWGPRFRQVFFKAC